MTYKDFKTVNIKNELHKKLRIKAAKSGKKIKEELNEILEKALLDDPS